jgi:hypothetical protein
LLLAPFLVLVVIWIPQVQHYRAPEVEITKPMVEVAQRTPADAVLTEVREFSLLPIEGRTREAEVSLAEAMLEGRLALPGLPEARFTVAFAPQDFERLPAGLQLWYAGWIVPDVLLGAYVDTGREEFFAAARDFIASWDVFERATWLPVGLLWNDHAVAARAQVLVEYWRIDRSRPDARPDAGRAILAQAARYGWFLSNPGHFTFATNHGLMQNLGLLELGLAFPGLPGAPDYERIALQRLGEQLPYLIDDAGAMRENSAGYQAFDLRILAMTFRCMALLGESVPPAWAAQYSGATRFLGTLLRPDGTLPASGDTDGAPVDLPPVTDIDAAGMAGPLHALDVAVPGAVDTLDPDGGYWVRWTGLDAWPSAAGVSQTVATWTRPPAPGHKHADDMSVLLWSHGVSWLTSVGYWPYDDASRHLAESWDGSNAPHLAGESAASDRKVEVLGSAAAPGLAALDLERTGPGGYRARRQIIQVEPGTWIVIDATHGALPDGNQTVWTLSPDVELATSAPGSYDLRGPAGTVARLAIAGSPGTAMGTASGSLAPFAGWHVRDGRPQPAPAIRVDQPDADAWLALVLTAGEGSTTTASDGAPGLSGLEDPESWTVTIPTAAGDLSVSRSGRDVSVTRPGGTSDTIALVARPQSQTESAARAAFQATAARYPVFRDLAARRQAASLAILALVLVQELILLLARRRRPRTYTPLRVLGMVGWSALAAVLGLVILQPWVVLTLAGG